MTLPISWVSVDLLSGQVIGDLTNIELTEVLSHTIGQSDQTTANYYVDVEEPPSFWATATTPMKAALIAYTGDPADPNVLWGGVIQQRVRDHASNMVQLALITLEGLLDYAYLGDYTATDVNQDTLIPGLCNHSPDLDWAPFDFVHTTASTQTQSVAYTADSFVTVLDALQSIAGVSGGPEWTIRWTWDATNGIFRPKMYYGQTIGTVTAAPAVTIESGDLYESTLTEDWSPGMGANIVTAYGSAEDPTTDTTDSSTDTSDPVTPTVTVQASSFNGRPPLRFVYQPNSTVSDIPTLTGYADAALAQLQNGSQPFSFGLVNDATGKTYGVDWQIGDSLGWYITGPTFPFPVAGSGRCIGVSIDYFSVTPIMQGVGLS